VPPQTDIRRLHILLIQREMRRRRLHHHMKPTGRAWIICILTHRYNMALHAVKSSRPLHLRHTDLRMPPRLSRRAKEVMTTTGQMGCSETCWQSKTLVEKGECLLSLKPCRVCSLNSLALRPSPESKASLVACFLALEVVSVASPCPAP
jgi:hypothetical protein